MSGCRVPHARKVFRAARLFLRIVWRDWEGQRVSARFAWSIARGVHSGPDRLAGMP